jgi:uncharacterized protein YdeI (YjbR/CyaY-like superfamily)
VKKAAVKPIFFATLEDFRAWLAANHGTATELWVGFRKVGTGRPSITWPQSVDEALCVGWIDGIRKRIDHDGYTIRFTPRKPTSTWSALNLKRMAELIAEGRVLPTGLEAYERRPKDRSGYSYEDRKSAKLDKASERLFRANAAAWAHFRSVAPSYRRTAIWWVVTAKKAETRRRRLAALIEACAAGRRIGILEPSDKARRRRAGR